MLKRPSILILHVSGSNRDVEAARACELAGGAPDIVHINQLRAGERSFANYDMLVLPGGFSYGDALGAGVRKALDLQVFFHDQILAFVDSGKRVLGICNGFQTLVKAGLLPGSSTARWPHSHRAVPAAATYPTATRSVTLTYNQSRRFECRWVHLSVNRGAAAGFLGAIDELIFCPVAHGEGNFQVKDEETMKELEEHGLIAFRYVQSDGSPAQGCYPANPNGSAADIAGLCNRRGNVLGLMPHPEDHVDPIQNPLDGSTRLGIALFKAMIHA